MNSSTRAVIRTSALLVLGVPLFLLAELVSAQTFTEVATGRYHVCAIDEAGDTECITQSYAKRLDRPETLPPLQAITAGDGHTCGISFDGQAVCWGGEPQGGSFNGNAFGQLDIPAIDTPLRSIDAGTNHTCAVDINNKAWCWGYNVNGQASPPDDGNGFLEVSAGRDGSCGLRLDGSVTCWPETHLKYSTNPPTGSYTDIELSLNRACGITDSGNIECWLGQDHAMSNGPYTDLAITRGSVCGLRQNGLLDCEFSVFNDDGSDFTDFPSETVFTSIEGGIVDFSSLVPSCGVDENGAVQCWGSGLLPDLSFGEMGAIDSNLLNVSLFARIYSDTRVELFWNNIQNEVRGARYEIYRDDVLVDTTSQGFSWLDSGLIAKSKHDYKIRAISENGQQGAFSNTITVDLDSRSVTGEGGNSQNDNVLPPHPTRPSNISIFRISGNIAILSWDRLSEVPDDFLGYEIRRDNVAIGFTRENIFFDDGIQWQTCYQYSIASVSVNRQVLDFTSRVYNRAARNGCSIRN